MSMQSKTSKEKKPITGVVCDVQNCAHHEGECYCTAGQIAVGPSFVKSCTDTVCATFKEKDNG